MKKMLFALLATVISLTATGCETIRGFGKDIQNTGGNIQDVVNRSDSSKP